MQFSWKQAFALTIWLVLPAPSLALAEDHPVADRRMPIPATEDAVRSNDPAVLTGKERLGSKWMDEQRIDNCKIPLDRRGTKSRPDNCSRTPAE
jgi:hypothetical protein